jgi:hypothetical protein
MSWVSFALMLLRVVNQIMTWARERELISKGQDIEIARTAASILAKTEYAKDVRDKITKMDDQAVDDALRALEPRPLPKGS